LNILDLLSFGLRLNLDDLLLKFLLAWVVGDQTSNDLVTTVRRSVDGRCALEAKCALADQSVKLIYLFLINDLLESVLVLRYLLVDDL
jgi:hypothetical protein